LHQCQCLPKVIESKECGKFLDLNLQVVRDVGGAASEQYEQSLYGSVSCGAHLTTTKTTEAVTNIIRQLCLANKYEQITLVAQYLERLKLCPFSPKEVIALIENVAKHIPDTGTAGTIYDFVYDNIRLQGPRLITCLVFPNLFTKAGPLSRVTSILAKGIAAQTTFIKTNSGVIFARCINPVSISACVAKCGPDDKAPVKFESAQNEDEFIVRPLQERDNPSMSTMDCFTEETQSSVTVLGCCFH
jgi:hypothetical protein